MTNRTQGHTPNDKLLRLRVRPMQKVNRSLSLSGWVKNQSLPLRL